jgi:glycosyltransferase involved in cell wall biosynthesis
LNYKKSARSIQTIATLREDLYDNDNIKELLFGDLIITYSDYAKNKLNSLGFENVKRVYPGVDLDLYRKTLKSEDLQKLFGINNDNFVVQYAGGEYCRLGAMDDIVSLVTKYAQEFKKRKMVFFFPGRMKGKEDFEKKNEIKKIIKKADAEDIVRYSDEIQADSQSHKLDWMSRVNNISDIVLFPVQNMKGKFDIPLFVPEAMACEKPVIISDLPILGELSNGKNSVIIPRGDVPALSEAIFDLFDNKEKREEIGKEARNFVEENFDIKNIAEIYRQIYEKL